jgi:hypothetical protein
VTLERSRPALNALATPRIVSIIGSAQNNAITVSRDTAGNLLINGGAVPIQGPRTTVANEYEAIAAAGFVLQIDYADLVGARFLGANAERT